MGERKSKTFRYLEQGASQQNNREDGRQWTKKKNLRNSYSTASAPYPKPSDDSHFQDKNGPKELGIANVIVEDLSRLSMSILSHVDEEKKVLVMDIHKLANLGVYLLDSQDRRVIVQEVVKSSLDAEAKMTLFEALYGRRCRSLIGCFEIGQTWSHEIWEEEEAPPHCISLYRILRIIGNVVYELYLPTSLASIHPIFYVSMLKTCVDDPSLIVPVVDVGVADSLSYEKVSIDTLNRRVRRLRTKDVASLKVIWRNQKVEKATWEIDEDMRAKYPFLFHMLNENV
ncbi:uncharacterized protein LOC124889708 [Capsicum annuum]|uniref:uncharacterized protein LOC124889708 n=1 Tax=Capsicum annuum TaxID=4072 RepID=UPI001FB05DE8|nr:uncharacterized protein LOC124889708 [Capsicum annuum]